jgi:hypothetical protein
MSWSPIFDLTKQKETAIAEFQSVNIQKLSYGNHLLIETFPVALQY